jgi:Na+(H+)/acetate symporter ActP
VLSGTIFGLVVLLVPAFADWVKLTFGGPAIPSTAIAFAAGVVVSLITPRSTASEEERQMAVFAAREGKM